MKYLLIIDGNKFCDAYERSSSNSLPSEQLPLATHIYVPVALNLSWIHFYMNTLRLKQIVFSDTIIAAVFLFDVETWQSCL